MSTGPAPRPAYATTLTTPIAVMRTVREYQRHAEECDALAAKATSPDQRQMILDMANTWRLLAAQRRQKLVKEAVARHRADPIGRTVIIAKRKS